MQVSRKRGEVQVHLAAYLARKDEALAKKGESLTEKLWSDMEIEASQDFQQITQKHQNKPNKEEAIATEVYSAFISGTKASKPIAAQYLAELLDKKQKKEKLTPEEWRKIIPPYLINAIDYVTGDITITNREDVNGI